MTSSRARRRSSGLHFTFYALALAQFTFLPTLWAQADEEGRLHAVFLIHEDEYETKRTVPEFARAELEAKLGWKCTYLFGDGLHNIRGTEALRDADLMFVSVRRQALPPEQFRYIKEYCEAGKPVVGIRTASHAFAERRGKPSPGGVLWPEFDGEILGGNYSGHHDSKSAGAPVTRVEVAKEALGHPILKGVPRDAYATSCSLYKVTPLSTNATVLMLGEIEGHEAQPVAWTNVGKYGNRVFYTSLGHPDDFEIESFRTLLRNGILWAVGETAETGLTAEEASSLN